jgi:regulator of protease activity HflC (stomatin/prohibitin superfamily)
MEIQDAIQKAANNSMLIVESVQVENIDFSDAYEKSIEQRMLAEVEVQKVQQNAEREKVQAEIAVIQAKAQADAVKLQGDAEAHAINARGKALRDNPSLVQLVQAEKWDGKLPTTMVPGQTVPFINVK